MFAPISTKKNTLWQTNVKLHKYYTTHYTNHCNQSELHLSPICFGTNVHKKPGGSPQVEIVTDLRKMSMRVLDGSNT